MAKSATGAKMAGVSDEAVQKATGKTWPEWFAVLDKASAQNLSHKEIVAVLRERHGLGGWWQQMVTVGYEQGRKKRDKGQMADGYQVSASKTVAAPLARLYAAWTDEAARAKWLGRKPLAVSTATERKSMRLAWGKGRNATRVSVNFYAKGKGKSQAALEHSQLPDAAQAEKMKTMWRAALEKMKGLLEK
jgi:uncharacterized protein YndB with AHSA1/START domain